MISGGEIQEQLGNGNLGGPIVGLVRQARRARRGLADVHETDKEGKFRAEAKNSNCWIVVTHPTGYAELPGMPNSNPRIIKLKPWARIEGTYQVARQPKANTWISGLRAQYFFGQNSPQIMAQSLRATDAHGRFVFDHIVPGQQRISSSRGERPRRRRDDVEHDADRELSPRRDHARRPGSRGASGDRAITQAARCQARRPNEFGSDLGSTRRGARDGASRGCNSMRRPTVTEILPSTTFRQAITG